MNTAADTTNSMRNDPRYEEAKQVVIKSGKPSISRIQRCLRIGYNYAARLLEAMEGEVVTAADQNGIRQMLIQANQEK